MAHQKSSKSRSCFSTGDCESSFTMRVKCGKFQMTTLLLALSAVLFTTSTLLYSRHYRSIANNVATTSAITEAIREKRRTSLHLPAKEKMTNERRGEIQQFFEQRIKPQEKMGMKGKKQGLAKKAKPKPAPKLIDPIPSSLASNATFAACLLIKDDNRILPEWLAYHYHVIGLRHVIVAVDPLSNELPKAILERWRSLTDMNIIEWTDQNYMPSDFLIYNKPPEKYLQDSSTFSNELSGEDILEISNHRYRQRVFLAKCMKEHRDMGNSWVMHIDTDEYVVASKLLRQMKPGHLTIPPMDQPGAVLNLLQQAVEKTPAHVSYPCISMLRVLFGSVESSAEEVNKDVPVEFKAEHFESLRWRYHARPHNMTFHGNPKVILDVAAIPEEKFPEDIVFSIHRPVEAFCHKNKEVAFTSFRKQPIAVNHYLGSWERYAGRNDKRRSREVYDAKAKVQVGKDDGGRLWLQGFTKTVGFDRARILLGEFYIAEGLHRSVPETILAE